MNGKGEIPPNLQEGLADPRSPNPKPMLSCLVCSICPYLGLYLLGPGVLSIELATQVI